MAKKKDIPKEYYLAMAYPGFGLAKLVQTDFEGRELKSFAEFLNHMMAWCEKTIEEGSNGFKTTQSQFASGELVELETPDTPDGSPAWFAYLLINSIECAHHLINGNDIFGKKRTNGATEMAISIGFEIGRLSAMGGFQLDWERFARAGKLRADQLKRQRQEQIEQARATLEANERLAVSVAKEMLSKGAKPSKVKAEVARKIDRSAKTAERILKKAGLI